MATSVTERLSERDVVALTLWAEARGESIDGRVAVAMVVVNRARLRRQTPKAVCLSPMQFSCWQPIGGAKNHRMLLEMAEAVVAQKPAPAALVECQWIADGVLAGQVRDNTKGADHYLTAALLSSTKKPRWVASMEFTVAIGSHAFYRSEGREQR